MTYQLIIRNGTVVDGSGAAPYRADVGVEGGLITRIGNIRSKAEQVIDADGHVVTPGFIDGHTHLDAQVNWDPLGTSSCWHGVTTAVMGHCGFSIAPVRPGQEVLVVRNLERAEDMSPVALGAGIQWKWARFREYLEVLDGLPMGINYAANIGHSALRTWAMGERAFEMEAAEADLDVMRRELRDALEAGAVGFSTSRSHHHLTSDDRPVASRTATWNEVRDLVNVMSDVGAGVFQTTKPAPGATGDPQDRASLFGRLRDLAVSSRVPVVFGLGLIREDYLDDLRFLDEVATAGGRVSVLSHSRGVSTVSSFKTRLPFDGLPVWRKIRTLPLAEQSAAFRDETTRRRLVETARYGDYGNPVGAEARAPDYSSMRVLFRALPPNPTVAEVAQERGVDPVEAIIDLALESNFAQLFVQPIGEVDRAALLAVMKHPRSVMTFSDAGAHVSQVMDSSIQTHLLAYWVREQEEIRLEEAVRMMTYAPAVTWGFHDRGLVREGLAADLNVIDPERVGPVLPEVVGDLPGGATRLIQHAQGFRATIVAGQVVLEEGEHTGALPGRLLRGPLAK